MNDTFTKTVIECGIDRIQDMIDNGERVEATELHNTLYNEDYFIIGSYKAEKALEDYGIFAAIETVVEYEKDNFGEVNTDINSEAIANMLAYIIGEEALNKCNQLSQKWDSGELSEDDLIAIKLELEEQL